GAAGHEIPEQLGEDDLVADHRPEPGVLAETKDRLRLAHTEVGDELRPATHEAEQPAERHVLAERHEVDLIIFARNALSRQQKRAVEELAGRAVLTVDGPDQERRAERDAD